MAEATDRKPGSWGCLWVLLALIGVVVAGVTLAQARYQTKIEAGIEGSFDIEDCGHKLFGRSGENGWSCDGTFRPDDGGAPRRPRLQIQSNRGAPHGTVRVQATEADAPFVYLPNEVSPRRRRAIAAAAILFVTVPALLGPPIVRRLRRVRRGGLNVADGG